MNVDLVLDTAIKAIKASLPDAVYNGSLIKETRSFNPATRVNEIIASVVLDVEIIFDTVTTEDVSGSNISDSVVKFYVIANQISDIDFYDVVRVAGKNYRISRKIETLIGTKVALFTILATSGQK